MQVRRESSGRESTTGRSNERGAQWQWRSTAEAALRTVLESAVEVRVSPAFSILSFDEKSFSRAIIFNELSVVASLLSGAQSLQGPDDGEKDSTDEDQGAREPDEVVKMSLS